MKRFGLVLAAAAGTVPLPACAQQPAYPASQVLGEFKATCVNVGDLSAVRQRAIGRGWQESAPAPSSGIGQVLAEMRADPKKLILKQTYNPVFALQRTMGSRTLWLVLSDMHVPNSEKLQRQRSCAVYDEGASEITETDASAVFGRKPVVNRTKFESQLYWDPPVMPGTSYTAVVHCRDLCVDVRGLKLEASLMDWKDGQHAW